MRRITELDAMRGLGALTIAVYHLDPEDLWFLCFRVDFFLVLSGFLVTAMILRYRESERFLQTFYARRAVRVWPCYYLGLLLVMLVNPLLPKAFPLDGLPNYLTFTQNVQHYWGGEVPAFNWYFIHSWTLAILEQFYFVWPVVLLLVGRRGLIPAALAVTVGSASLRAAGLHAWVLLAHADGLALGAILAVLLTDARLVERRPRTLRNGLLAAMALGLAVLAGEAAIHGVEPVLRFDNVWPGLTVLAANVFYFGGVGLIALNTGHPSLGWLRHPWLKRIGTYSYGIYLFHPLVIAPLHILGRASGIGRPFWLDVLAIAGSVAVAAVLFNVIERPLQRLKDRFTYRPPATAGKPGVLAVGSSVT